MTTLIQRVLNMKDTSLPGPSSGNADRIKICTLKNMELKKRPNK